MSNDRRTYPSRFADRFLLGLYNFVGRYSRLPVASVTGQERSIFGLHQRQVLFIMQLTVLCLLPLSRQCQPSTLLQIIYSSFFKVLSQCFLKTQYDAFPRILVPNV